jgi:hypothetical protein
MKKNVVTLFVVLAVTLTSTVFAQKPAVVTNNDPGWKRIGQTTASFKMQNESIVVLGADEFTAIKLKVKDAPLNIERLQVFYESGDMEEIDVRNQIGENGETRAISLKHPDRDIKKVAFTYKTAANTKGDKADVELYGLKTNQPAGSDSYRDNDNLNRDVNRTENDVDSAAHETGHEMKTGMEKAGDKISEGVNDAAAAIKDQKVKNKVGPGNETVYIDDNGQYYYINNEGNRVNITKLQLHDKPDQK